MFAEEHVVVCEENEFAEEHVEEVEAVAEREAALADRTVPIECPGAMNDTSRSDGRVDEVETVDAGDPWPARRVVTWAPENLGTGMKENDKSLAEDDVLGGGLATVLCGGGGMNDI